MNNAVASAMVQAAHRVEARLEEALAGVGLSIAKFETLSILVSQDRPISLSELAAKLVCVRSNVTQLVDRLETEGLVKRADESIRPEGCPRGSDGARTETAGGRDPGGQRGAPRCC
jgi:predicted transcriptional regulator